MIKKLTLITSIFLLSSCADTTIQDVGSKLKNLFSSSDPVVEVADLGEDQIILDAEYVIFSEEELSLFSDEELAMLAQQQGLESLAELDEDGNLLNREELINQLIEAQSNSAQSNSAQSETAVDKLVNSGASFILYFSYDDTEIDEQATQIIIEHANFMRDNPELSLRLEGHADERGTREYNLALGENRALSVKEVLGLYGLENRIEVVSFGEEKPIAFTHDESSWQKNRRVEFVYQ